MIGNDETRHFVMVGSPIVELKHAKRVSLPNDLVLSSSAWQHCTPSQYDYVIKDAFNVKVYARHEDRRIKIKLFFCEHTFAVRSKKSRSSRKKKKKEKEREAVLFS